MRHVVEDLGSVCPVVQILDLPVPHMMDQFAELLNLEEDVLDAGRLVDRYFQVPELVIEVPKFIIKDVPMRTSVPEPQLAEQLVEVPTIVSFSSLQRIMEQTVDIPVPKGGGRHADLQGFLRGQNSTGFEQIVDVPRWRSSSPSPLPRQGGGRGRRGRRGRGGLVPPLFLVVDNDSGLLAMLVSPVMMHLALCSLLAPLGPSECRPVLYRPVAGGCSAGYRSAEDPASRCPYACGPARYAVGGTVGGSTDDLVLLFVTADCGTARRHSSSWWWRTKFWSSRFFLRTAFNSVAHQKTHFYPCSCMYKAGIAGYYAPRAVFPSLVGRPPLFGLPVRT